AAAMAAVTCAADAALVGVTSADPICKAIGNCTGAGKALTYDTSAHTFGCNTVSSGMNNPMTTTGDIIYSSDGSGTPARLAVGGANTFVKGGGSTPAYAQPAFSNLSGTIASSQAPAAFFPMLVTATSRD